MNNIPIVLYKNLSQFTSVLKLHKYKKFLHQINYQLFKKPIPWAYVSDSESVSKLPSYFSK
jgi:hypothetical protein